VGVVAHRILERWNFDEPAERMPTQIAPALHGISGLDDQALTQELTESLRELLAAFGRSESYQRLRSANILGREVPFVTPWEDGQMMEGVIDVIYRLDGKIWLADYKTDRIRAEDAAERARQYAHQAAVYLAAAERGLGQPIAGFQFMFLRTGTMVGGNS
jgi:ATP-dependent helicase/nuclease subunit A